jgi:hypothetical protein
MTDEELMALGINRKNPTESEIVMRENFSIPSSVARYLAQLLIHPRPDLGDDVIEKARQHAATLLSGPRIPAMNTLHTSPDQLNTTMDRILEGCFRYVIPGTVIQGGNFQIRNGEYKTNPLSTETFRAAVGLHRMAKEQGIKTTLALLVDNLGGEKTFDFPEEYLQILKADGTFLRSKETLTVLLFLPQFLR